MEGKVLRRKPTRLPQGWPWQRPLCSERVAFLSAQKIISVRRDDLGLVPTELCRCEHLVNPAPEIALPTHVDPSMSPQCKPIFILSIRP